MERKKAITLEVICYAIILLFMYAALSKLFMYDIYKYDLGRSPYIGKFAPYLSLTLPFSEIAISVMLFFESTRRLGLWLSFLLMCVFTVYVGLMIGILNSRPCTCGGLIRELTWRQHFALNIFYTAIAGIGIWLHKNLIVQWQRS